MDPNDIKPIGGPEPTVTYRLQSDLDHWVIKNKEGGEAVIEITGYDLQARFNTKYLKTVEDIEAACNGIHNLFRELILESLLGKPKPDTEE